MEAGNIPESTKDLLTGDNPCLNCTKCADGSIRHVKRDNNEIKSMTQRLSRIEGQVRGVKKMLEEDRYCVDILTQVASIQAALNGFNRQLLTSHIRSCVCNDIRAGKEEAVDELCGLLKKLMK